MSIKCPEVELFSAHIPSQDWAATIYVTLRKSAGKIRSEDKFRSLTSSVSVAFVHAILSKCVF